MGSHQSIEVFTTIQINQQETPRLLDLIQNPIQLLLHNSQVKLLKFSPTFSDSKPDYDYLILHIH
jgi:hypothetical protein